MEQEKGCDGQVFDTSRPRLTTRHSLYENQMNIVRVLLVDDHPMMREGLGSIVAAYERHF